MTTDQWGGSNLADIRRKGNPSGERESQPFEKFLHLAPEINRSRPVKFTEGWSSLRGQGQYKQSFLHEAV
eukprot:439844-Prorocentrum_minimum.AAC.1